MDLNLNENDTFLLENIQRESWNEKDVVESVIDTNYKIINLKGTNYFNDISFTEGIGPSFYVHYLGQQDYNILLCAFKNDTLTYHNPAYDTCFIKATWGNINKTIFNPIEIIPNPARDFLHILTIDQYYLPFLFLMINAKGQIVFQKIIYDTEEIIDISFLLPGFYIGIINNNIYKKIIINGY